MPDAILVIDDHPLFRAGLQSLIAQLCPDARLLLADDAPTGLSIAREQPDIGLVLIDRYLPRMNGLAAIPLFCRILPRAAIVMISAAEQASDARTALLAGARGFLPKSSNSQTILNALRLVIDGGTYIPPMMLGELGGLATGHPASASAVDEFGLTARQLQVLTLISAGLSNKDIATKLNLAQNTVKVHISGIFKVLGVISRTQAVAVARERNIPLQDP